MRIREILTYTYITILHKALKARGNMISISTTDVYNMMKRFGHDPSYVISLTIVKEILNNIPLILPIRRNSRTCYMIPTKLIDKVLDYFTYVKNNNIGNIRTFENFLKENMEKIDQIEKLFEQLEQY